MVYYNNFDEVNGEVLPKGNPADVAVEFLRWLDPDGTHHLEAFDPTKDRGTPLSCKTFAAGDWEGIRTWVAAHAGHHNVYYMANEVRPDLGSASAEKHDIVQIRVLHADVDPPKGVDIDTARENILRTLASAKFAFSAVVDSGGGYQALMRLDKKLDHTHETRNWTENHNRGFAADYGGDGVSNVNRLMRLPGPDNIPTPDKRTRGRVQRPASIVTLTHSYFSRERISNEKLVTPMEAGVGGDNSEEVCEARDEIRCSGYDCVSSIADLPEELRDRFEIDLLSNGPLAKLWAGEPPKGGNVSGSDYRFALAGRLKAVGGYTAEDFAFLCYAWEHSVGAGKDQDESLTLRELSRAWGRVNAAKRQEVKVEDHLSPVDDTNNGTTEDADIKVQEAKSRPPFSLQLIGEIEPRPPEYLVAGLIETDSLAVVFGEPGCGKSFLALDIGLSVATGHAFHSRPVKSGPVVYIAGEGHSGLARRKDAWAASRAVDLVDVPLWLSGGAAQFLDGASLKAVAEAIDGVAETQGAPALIVIDTLARNFGPGDENGTSDMSKFVAAVDLVRRRYKGCTALIVHHSGLMNKGRARGSGALHGANDAEYRVEKKEAEIGVFNTRMKDAPQSEPLYFRLESVDCSNEHGPFSSAVLINTAPQAKALALSGTEALGAKTLLAAANDRGDPDAPVSLKAWRTVFYAQHSGKTNDGKRRAFNRVRKDLEDKSVIVELAADDGITAYTFTQGGFSLCGTSGTNAGHVPLVPPGAQRSERDKRDTPLQGCPHVPPAAGSKLSREEVFG